MDQKCLLTPSMLQKISTAFYQFAEFGILQQRGKDPTHKHIPGGGGTSKPLTRKDKGERLTKVWHTSEESVNHTERRHIKTIQGGCETISCRTAFQQQDKVSIIRKVSTFQKRMIFWKLFKGVGGWSFALQIFSYIEVTQTSKFCHIMAHKSAEAV